MPAKRCPMCHRASEGTAWKCACGYEFGKDIETVRGMLRSQLRNSWITFSLVLVLDLGLVALAVAGAALTPIFALLALLGVTSRTLRKILVSRESLRQLAPAELPTARLLT
jgi:hypothetical protein